MSDLAVIDRRIPAMSDAALDKVRRLETLALGAPQVPLTTAHVLHGGMYARTVCLPPGTMITGALVKVATVLIVEGDAVVYVGDAEPIRLQGYNVLPASAGRKQAFVAVEATNITMLFPTEAKTVEEAERHFTDECGLLSSRHEAASNHVLITGE